MSKKSRKKVKPKLAQSNSLLAELDQVMEADLCLPAAEYHARKLLNEVRTLGYKIGDFDLFDPNCLACLYSTLMTAHHVVSSVPTKTQ